MTEKPLAYLSGFGNEHSTEAVASVLPEGRNSPQHPPLGLYAEQLSGTPFTAPRHANRRSWLYRILPSAVHKPFRRIDNGLWRSAPFTEVETPPNRVRWDPLPLPTASVDFVDGIVTMGGNGDVAGRSGVAIQTIVSTPGEGTEVSLYFPSTAETSKQVPRLVAA